MKSIFKAGGILNILLFSQGAFAQIDSSTSHMTAIRVRSSQAGTNSSLPPKPTSTSTPNSGVVPAPAASVGYNTRTLGPAVVIGQNWFILDPAAHVITNPDSSVTLAGPWDANAQITTGDGHSFGTCFSGGFYAEMDFMWTGPFDGSGVGTGWPAFWANAAESRKIGATNWPGAGGRGGGYSAIELDIFEFFNDGWGPTVWDWADGTLGKAYSPFPNVWNAQGGVKNNTTKSFSGTRHKIGCLWVPATNTTKGRIAIYLDRVIQSNMTQVWDKWNPNTTPPLINGTTSDAIIDIQHLFMLAGSSASNPMTVYGVEIWQKDGSQNLPPTPTPSKPHL